MKKSVSIVTLFCALFFISGCAFFAKQNDNGSKNIVTVSVDKKPVFNMTLPDKWSSEVIVDKWKTGNWKSKTVLLPPSKYPHIQLWRAPGCKTVKAAVSKIAKLIKSEVIEFKIKKNKKITVAGASAKHLIGTGLEADDQDPSNADVYVFKVKSKVFILCVHGEGDEAAKQRTTVKAILATVK